MLWRQVKATTLRPQRGVFYWPCFNVLRVSPRHKVHARVLQDSQMTVYPHAHVDKLSTTPYDTRKKRTNSPFLAHHPLSKGLRHMADFLTREAIDEISKETSGSGRYLNPSKFTEETRLRLFGAAITGFEGWTEDNMPIRWEIKPEELPANIRVQQGFQTLKRFIMVLAYDYASDEFKILQLTQKTLMDQLFKYMADEDYGSPHNYDIKISKKGEGKKTEYTLVAAPPKEVKPSIQARYDEIECDLNRIYDNEDPFGTET